MPTTLQNKVEDIIGSIGDTAALNDWLTSGAKFISDVVPPNKLMQYQTAITDPDGAAGISIIGYRILRAHKSGYRANIVDAGYKAQLIDTKSIYLATASNPRCYFENGKGYVIPSGGSIIVYAYPTATYSDTSIASFPLELEYGVILFACIRGRIRQLTDLISTTLENVIITLPLPPTAPNSPSFVYTDAVIGSIAQTVLSALGTSPSYTKPTISLTSEPTDLSLSSGLLPPVPPNSPSFSSISISGTTVSATTVGALSTSPSYTKPTISLTVAPGDFSTLLSSPAVITAPLFTAISISASTVAATTVGALTTAPSYTKPAITLTTAPTDFDFSVDVVKPTAPSAPSFSVISITGATVSSTTVGALGTSPSYNAVLPVAPSTLSISATAPTALTAPSFTYSSAVKVDAAVQAVLDLSTQFSSLATNLDTNNDIELAQAKINEIQIRIKEYDSEVVQAQQTLLQNAREEVDVNKQNAIQGLLSQIQEYDAKIKRYSSELGVYQAQIQMAVQEHNSNIDAYTKESQLVLQDALNEFNEANVVYQANIQYNIEQARITAQENIQNARNTQDAAIQQAQIKLSKEHEEYVDSLSKYANDVRSYQGIVNKEIGKYNLNLQKWQTQRNTELQQYVYDIQNELNEFNKETTAYQTDLQQKIEQARVKIQESLLNAKNSQDASIQQAQIKLAKEQQEYTLKLQKFSEDLRKYQADLNGEIQIYTANMEKWQIQRDTELKQYATDIQNELNEFNKEVVIYQSDLQQKIEQSRITVQEALTNASNTQNAATQNAQIKLAKEHEEYIDSISKYSNEIQEYQIEVNNEISVYSANLQKWQTQRANELSQFQLDIQNELNEFNKESIIYQTDLQHKIKQSELDERRLEQVANMTTNVNIQNEAKALEKQISQYRSELEKYNSEISSYSINVNGEITKTSTLINKYNLEHSSLESHILILKGELNDFLNLHKDRGSNVNFAENIRGNPASVS